MLIGGSACALHPLARHASSETARLGLDAGFTPLPVLGLEGVVGIHGAARHPGSGEAARRTVLRPAVPPGANGHLINMVDAYVPTGSYPPFSVSRRGERIVMNAQAIDKPLVQCVGGPGISGVIWDVDGTLAASTDLGFSATNEVLRGAGHAEITKQDYELNCKYTTPRRFAAHATGNPDDPSGVALGDAFDNLYVDMVNDKTCPLYGGIPELLAEQRSFGRSQAVLSNACGAYARAVLDANKISDVFVPGAALGADDVPEAKPSGAGLQQIAQAMGLKPSECIYVGDSPTDGGAAANAGMHSVGVTYGASDRARLEGKFDVIVDTVDELRMALCVNARP